MIVTSLGWGVQSFTLAAMSALGDLEPVDFAIHADTTWERQHTYEFAARWSPWLEAHGVKAVTVRCDKPDPCDVRGGMGIPAYTKRVIEAEVPEVDDNDEIIEWTKTGQTVTKVGTLRRQCTHEWKVRPMRAYLHRLADRATMLIGISADEWHRAKDADVRWLTHRYPLLDAGMTRADCIAYLERRGLEVPGKSSCTFCPFHNGQAWREMKRAGGHDWQQAVEIDAAIRDKRPPYPLFVHRRCLPLPEAVDIPEDHGYTQPSLLDVCDSGACFL